MSDLEDPEEINDDGDAAELDEADQLEAVADDEEVEIGDDDLEVVDDDDAGELRAVEEELSQKDQNARSLAIRRAIEQRMDQKRLDEDLDYLDLDLED